MKKYIFLICTLLSAVSVYPQESNWVIFKNSKLPFVNDTAIVNHLSIGTLNSKNRRNNIKTDLSQTERKNNFGLETKSENVLPDNFIVCMTLDHHYNLWVGTQVGGVAKYDGREWTVYNTFNSKLPSNTVFALAVDTKNIIWIGTTNGLAKLNGSEWKVFNNSNSKLPSNVIYSLAIDHEGVKWIGTSAGLAKFNDRKWTIYNSRNSRLTDNHVTALAVDKSGNKWIGTFEGLTKFGDGSWRIFHDGNSGLPFNDIYAISVISNDHLLIQTWGGGLARFEKGKWKKYDTENSRLPDDYVSSIQIDKKGNYWIGTLSGLAKFDGRNWQVFKKSNSKLPDDAVYSLLYDRNENLWIGTQNGLAVYNESRLNNHASTVSGFTASVSDNNISLSWNDGNDPEIIAYELEKRSGEMSWRKTGSLKAKNKNGLNSYSFTDHHSASESVQYRLRQIFSNGDSKYSNAIDVVVPIPFIYSMKVIQSEQDTPPIRIEIGLPVNSLTKLSLTDEFGRETIILNGSELKAGYHEIPIDTHNLSTGIYLCKLSANNFIDVKKILVKN